jgi:hypothetical protein
MPKAKGRTSLAWIVRRVAEISDQVLLQGARSC